MKKIKLLIAFFTIGMTLQSCYFPSYQSVAETNPYLIDFSKGKWYLNNIQVNGKSDFAFDELTEKSLSNCLNDSLYLSYGKRKAIYKVPIITEQNASENLSLLKATQTVDYVIQITGIIGKNEIGAMNIKPMKNEQKTSASIQIQVYDVNQKQLIYGHQTTGNISIENNSEDVVFGKSAQSILKKCLEKELKLLLKHGGCQKK